MTPLFFDILARDMSGGAFAGIEARAKKLSQTFKTVGESWSLYITAPITAGGLSILKAGADFEEAMNAVDAAAGGLDTSAFDALSQKAIELGANTQFGAREGANAIENLIRNGLDAQQVLAGAANATVMLASATKGSLASSADLTTDIMQQFNKKAEELGGIADQVSGTMVASKLDFDNYRLALGQAGGVAGKVGVEFEDFNAAIAATSSSFNSGSDAGTSFKTFLINLTPKSEAAAAAMEKLGLNFFDAEGNMKPMAQVAEQLRVAFGKMSEEQRIATASTIFGSDAMRTAFALAEQGADGVNRYADAIGKVVATRQAEALMRGFNGAVRELSGAFETLTIAIYKAGLGDWATQAVQAFTEVVRAMGQASPEVLRWGTIVAGATAAVGPLLLGLSLFVRMVGMAVGVLAPLGALIAGVLTSPLTLAAVAAGAAAYAFGVSFDDIAGAARAAMDTLGPVLASGLELLRGWGSDIASVASSAFGTLADYARALAGQIGPPLAQALSAAAAGAADAFGAAFNGVTAAARTTMDTLAPVLASGLQMVRGWGAEIATATVGAFNGMVSAAISLGQTIGPTIAQAFASVGDGLSSFGSGFMSGFDPAPMFEAMGRAARTAGEGFAALKGALGSAGEAIAQAYNAVVEFGSYLSGGAIGRWISEMAPNFQALGAAVGTLATDLLALPFAAVDRGLQMIGQGFTALKDGYAVLRDVISSLADGTLADKFPDMAPGIEKALAPLRDLQSVAGSVADVMGRFGRAIGEALQVATTAFGEFASGFAQEFDIGPTFKAIVDAATSAGQAFGAFAGAMKEIGGLIVDVVKALGDLGAWLAGDDLTGWFQTMMPQFKEFGGTMGQLASSLLALPFTAIKAGFDLIGGGFTLLGNGVSAVREGLSAILDGSWREKLGAFADTLKQSFADMWPAVIAEAQAGAESLAAVFGDLADKAIAAIGRLVDGVSEWMTQKLGAVWDAVAAKIDWVGQKFYGLYDAVVGHSYIPDMVDGIETHAVGRLGLIWDQVSADVARTKGAFAGLGSGVVSDLKRMVADGSMSMRELGSVGPLIMTEMRDRIIDGALDPLAKEIDAAFAKLKTVSPGTVIDVGSLVDISGLQAKLQAVSAMAAQINAAVAGSVEGTTSRVGQLADETSGIFSGMGTRIVDGLKNILSDGKVTMDEFRDMALSIFQDILNRVLDTALKPLENALNNVFDNIGGGGSGGGSGGGGAAGGLGDGLSGMFDKLVGGLGNMLTGLLSGLGKMLTGLLSSLGNVLGSIFGSLFGGLFADGGTLSAGKWGVVGEAGPELIKGGSSGATIKPISMSAEAAAPRHRIELNPTVTIDLRGYTSREDVGRIAEEAARRGTMQAVEISRQLIIPTINDYQRDTGY